MIKKQKNKKPKIELLEELTHEEYFEKQKNSKKIAYYLHLIYFFTVLIAVFYIFI